MGRQTHARGGNFSLSRVCDESSLLQDSNGTDYPGWRSCVLTDAESDRHLRGFERTALQFHGVRAESFKLQS